MSTLCDGGEFTFSCDGCPEVYEVTDPDEVDACVFEEVWAAARKAGWRAFKAGGEWEHYCPGCD